MAKKGASAEDEELEIPNAPVNPMARSIVASYSASCSINYDDELPSYPTQFFHIHPFGVEKTYPRRNLIFKHSRNLLPPYNENGYLFIGLEKAKPGQVISFYFELKTVNIREQNAFNLPKTTWSYLTRNNQYVLLDEAFLLSDTTDQFTKSGIIKIQLPRDISSRGTIMPNGLYWLRVSVFGDTELLCHTLDLRTQGITAKWVDNGKSDMLRIPLKPNSIQDLHEKRFEITEVQQGYESFGGRAAESQEEYFSRVSERLRHKQRVITHWDIERITLDKFHDIHQVKCVSYLSDPMVITTDDEDKKNEIYGLEQEDGLSLIVVPKRSYYLKNDTPVVNFKKLQQIENEIRKYLSPFVKLKVRNPIYEYIRIICKIKFDDNSNAGHLIKKLKTDVKKLISPWIYDHNAEIQIGTNLYLDSVFNYIQSLPYVQFVTKFSLLQIIEGDDGFYNLIDTANFKDQNIILRPSKPWTVFVLDEDHKIEIHDREEIDEVAEPVKPPVSFKTRHNILKRSKFIKILWPKDDILEKEVEEENAIYTVNIKL